MKRPPTIRQKKLVKAIVADNYRTKGELLESVGYSKASIEQPSRIINSQGVQRLIAEADAINGLDDTSVLQVIRQAIQDRDYKQGAQVALKWLQLKYNTTTRFTESKSVTINNPNPELIDDQAHIYIARKYDIPVNYLKAYLREYKPASERGKEKKEKEGTPSSVYNDSTTSTDTATKKNSENIFVDKKDSSTNDNDST